ncbi:MAG: hypothetical protein M3325_14245 [Actinomycetota bacterium]|nr:hypothetical protein [Actinomycetota bacterium]
MRQAPTLTRAWVYVFPSFYLGRLRRVRAIFIVVEADREGLTSGQLAGVAGRVPAVVRAANRKGRDLLHDSFGRSTNADFVGWCYSVLGWIALHGNHLDKASTECHTSLRFADHVRLHA